MLELESTHRVQTSANAVSPYSVLTKSAPDSTVFLFTKSECFDMVFFKGPLLLCRHNLMIHVHGYKSRNNLQFCHVEDKNINSYTPENGKVWKYIPPNIFQQSKERLNRVEPLPIQLCSK